MVKYNCPEISVVIATHNRAGIIPKAVASIQNQTSTDLEIVIVDDASEDDTIETIRRLQKYDSRIRFICNDQNLGPGATRNRGFEEARGDFIAVMDDDDVSLKSRLEIQRRALVRSPRAGMVFSPVEWMNDGNKPFYVFPTTATQGEFPREPADVFRLLYLNSNKIPNTTVMFRRWVLEKFSYPRSPWIGEDWYLFMQLSAKKVPFVYCSEPLVRVERSSNNSLVRQPQAVINAPRQVLRMIKNWLKAEQIYDFDRLHKLAWSNQLAREGRAQSGFIGLAKCIWSLCIAPDNEYARASTVRLLQRAVNHYRRISL